MNPILELRKGFMSIGNFIGYQLVKRGKSIGGKKEIENAYFLMNCELGTKTNDLIINRVLLFSRNKFCPPYNTYGLGQEFITHDISGQCETIIGCVNYIYGEAC